MSGSDSVLSNLRVSHVEWHGHRKILLTNSIWWLSSADTFPGALGLPVSRARSLPSPPLEMLPPLTPPLSWPLTATKGTQSPSLPKAQPCCSAFWTRFYMTLHTLGWELPLLVEFIVPSKWPLEFFLFLLFLPPSSNLRKPPFSLWKQTIISQYSSSISCWNLGDEQALLQNSKCGLWSWPFGKTKLYCTEWIGDCSLCTKELHHLLCVSRQHLSPLRGLCLCCCCPVSVPVGAVLSLTILHRNPGSSFKNLLAVSQAGPGLYSQVRSSFPFSLHIFYFNPSFNFDSGFSAYSKFSLIANTNIQHSLSVL